MFGNTDPYTMWTELTEGRTLCYVSFKDGQGIQHTTEVSRSVYLELSRSKKAEHNLYRSDRRHIEQSELTESTLCKRALYTPRSLEDTICDRLHYKQVTEAILRLSQTQRQRLVFYYVFGFNYRKIAEKEGCSFQAIAQSVEASVMTVRNFINHKG